MRDGQRVFSHGAGVIVVSKNPKVNEELQVNQNFSDITPPAYRTIKIYVSKDLVPEIAQAGLPLNVRKFLCDKH